MYTILYSDRNVRSGPQCGTTLYIIVLRPSIIQREAFFDLFRILFLFFFFYHTTMIHALRSLTMIIG